MSDSEKIQNCEKQHGIGWKIYFVLLLVYLIFSCFLEKSVGMTAMAVFKAILTAIVLYSWIWAKHISWLSKIRWLVKIWSIQFFIAPVALIFYGYLAFTGSNKEIIEESIGWIISIIVYYPALYGIYRLAWKSSLLTSANSIGNPSQKKPVKKRDKFIIGGIILVALTKLPNLKEQTFGLSALIGLIIMGALVGLVGYAIFGRDKKPKQ